MGRSRAIRMCLVGVLLASAAIAGRDQPASAAIGGRDHPAVAAAELDYDRPVRGPVLRHFEPPETEFGPGHRGIDLAVDVGTLVRAPAPGTVAFAGQVGGDLFVSLDHADGIRTTYSFLSAVLVRRGEAVAQGAPIARTGEGHPGSDAPHLHLGARRGRDYLDPEALIVAGFRRNLWRVVRLAPGGGPAQGGGGGDGPQAFRAGTRPREVAAATALRPSGQGEGPQRA